MLNDQNATIEETFYEIRRRNLFDGKINTFRHRIDQDFVRISDDNGIRYEYIDPNKGTLLDSDYMKQLLYPAYTSKTDSKDHIELPEDFEQNLSEAKEKITPFLSENILKPNIQNDHNELRSSTLYKLNENIEGIMFKVDWLENKYKQIDKKVNELQKNKELNTEILKALYSVLHGRFSDEKK